MPKPSLANLDDIVDLLDAAAKRYPIKALAPQIRGDLTAGKAESTLRNELTQQPGYKLGLITAVQIMALTGDLSALDAIEDLFGRTAWKVPEVDHADPVPVMAKAGRLSKEFSDVIEATAAAMADGRLSEEENENLRRELVELVTVCIRFQAILRAMGRTYP